MWKLKGSSALALLFICAVFSFTTYGANIVSGIDKDLLIIQGNKNKIIGGDDASVGEFPWQVSIQFTDDFGYKMPICGGTIISTTQILTAAHCLRSPSGPIPISDLSIVAGAHDIFNLDGTEQVRNINKAVDHELFDLPTFKNDVAVLYLSSSLTFNSKVNSIGLGQSGIEPSGSCVATGWGNIRNDGGTQYPDVLQKVTLDIVDRSTCKDAYEEFNEITDGMICASAARKGTCLGDSGGPFVCTNQMGQKYLAGITSWGTDPCAINASYYPSVFTNVEYYSTWIGLRMK